MQASVLGAHAQRATVGRGSRAVTAATGLRGGLRRQRQRGGHGQAAGGHLVQQRILRFRILHAGVAVRLVVYLQQVGRAALGCRRAAHAAWLVSSGRRWRERRRRRWQAGN